MLRAVAAACLLFLTPLPAHAGEGCWDTAWRCQDIADYRGTPLDQSRGLQDEAKAWSRAMADRRVLSHSGRGSEIVGYGPDWLTIMAAWDLSPAHRALLLEPDFTELGIGVVRDDNGTLWATVRFE